MTHSPRRRAFTGLLVSLIAVQAVLAQDPVDAAAQAVVGKWTGSFRPGTMTGSIGGTLTNVPMGTIVSSTNTTGAPGRYSGTVAISPSLDDTPGKYRIEVRVSSNFNSSETLEWGVSSGRCGSKLIMLAASNLLPPIEMRSGGTGEVNEVTSLPLTSKGAFHVVLFKGGHLQQDVVACANLKFDGR